MGKADWEANRNQACRQTGFDQLFNPECFRHGARYKRITKRVKENSKGQA